MPPYRLPGPTRVSVYIRGPSAMIMRGASIATAMYPTPRYELQTEYAVQPPLTEHSSVERWTGKKETVEKKNEVRRTSFPSPTLSSGQPFHQVLSDLIIDRPADPERGHDTADARDDARSPVAPHGVPSFRPGLAGARSVV